MSQWFTATCWFRVNALRVQMQNHTIYLPYHWKGEGQAMLLGPTYNAPGSTKGVSIHTLTACLPLHLVWGPACPPAISSYLPLLSSPSQQTKVFFFLLFVIQHELSLFGLCSKRQMMGKTFLKLFHLSMTNAEIYMKHQQNGNTDWSSVQMKSAT